MSVFAQATEHFVAELDAATEAHLGWTRRVLRCAVLRTSPGEDVLAIDAHCRCRFGQWFGEYREVFAAINPTATAQVFEQHERMHSAVRELCCDLLADRPNNPANLDIFESTQSALVANLSHLKTEILARAARYDSLTGLPLRYGLEEEFARAQALAQRSGLLQVVVLIDVDHFKRVNDEHGHAVGDQALCHVALLLRAEARLGEPVFRFGGEEFLVILHAADKGVAEQVAGRFLQALRDAPMELPDGRALSLRISAGLAVVGSGESMSVSLEKADRALYAAKQAGRDRWLWGAELA